MRLLITSFILHSIYSPMIYIDARSCSIPLLSFILLQFLLSFHHIITSVSYCCLFMVYLMCLYVVSKTQNIFKPLTDAIDCIDCRSIFCGCSCCCSCCCGCDWLGGSMDRLIDHIDIEAKEPIVSYTFSLLKQFSTLALVNCMGALLEPPCMRQSN